MGSTFAVADYTEFQIYMGNTTQSQTISKICKKGKTDFSAKTVAPKELSKLFERSYP